MPLKSVPVSLRISPEDAEFLAGLKVEGAVTPSEKIRALIKSARLSGQRGRDYDSYEEIATEMIRPVLASVHSAEKKQAVHSELVTLQIEWLIEALAYVASFGFDDVKDGDLQEFEEGIADRCYRLFMAVTRLGVTKKAPCYDEKIIRIKLMDVSELVYIVGLTEKNGG